MESTGKILKVAGITAALGVAALSTNASASVIELALVIDGSGSISEEDFELQRDAYGNVFSDSNFYNTYVDPSPYDTLAVSAYQFSSGVTQEIGWTSITSQADATSFGGQFDFDQLGGLTNTEQGIEEAMNGLTGNGIDGDKMVIDVSTDGQPSTCSPACRYAYDDEAIERANEARDEGITVNALGVGSFINDDFLEELVGQDPTDSPGGFYLRADNFGEFQQTLQTKLGREITEQVPEPGSLALLGLGLAGLGTVRARARRS